MEAGCDDIFVGGDRGRPGRGDAARLLVILPDSGTALALDHLAPHLLGDGAMEGGSR
jgi:hypothetical protein